MTSGWALAIAKCRTIKLADGAEAVEADQDTIVDDVVVFRDGLRCFPHDGAGRKIAGAWAAPSGVPCVRTQ
jgi:hypothetical protein